MLTISTGEIKQMVYKGIPTINFISDNGTIYTKKMKPKKAHRVKGGYLRTGIVVNGKQKLALVHRLVAENFLGNLSDDMEVDHLNGNKEDNSVSNLDIVTPEENMRRAVKNKLILQGKDRSATKYDEKTIRKICENLEKETNKKKIADKLNVPVGLVRSIACGSKWKFISREYDIIPTKKKHKFNQKEIDKMLILYKSGKTYNKIADKLGVSYNAIIGALQRYSDERNRSHHVYTADEDSMILTLKKAGAKNKDIAKQLGVTKSAVASRYRYIKNNLS